MVRHLPTLSIAMSVTSLALILAQPASAETVTLGIGTQDTTTNTVTAGVVIRQLHLLEKYLPTSGKYANIKFELEWQNFTSGPPVTNAMMANKLQIGMMGDYPLIVNGFTFDSNPESKSRLIGVAAYSLSGSGNGIVVHKDSPYYDLADLKGHVSVNQKGKGEFHGEHMIYNTKTGEMESGDNSPQSRVTMRFEPKTAAPAASSDNNCGYPAGAKKPAKTQDEKH